MDQWCDHLVVKLRWARIAWYVPLNRSLIPLYHGCDEDAADLSSGSAGSAGVSLWYRVAGLALPKC